MPTKIQKSIIGTETPPTAYGYARISHLSGHKKGESVAAQHRRVNEYYKKELESIGVLWGGSKDDGKNVSAYRVPFQMRPAGKELMQLLKPGDHLIVDKVDRMWRSLEDFITMIKIFKQRDITIHIVSYMGGTLNSNTPLGDYMLKTFVMISEVQSQLTSERCLDVIESRKKAGVRYTGASLPGTEYKPSLHPSFKGVVHTIRWNLKERKTMKEIMDWFDEPTPELYVKHWNKETRKQARKIARSLGCKRRWIDNIYRYEAAYDYLSITDPTKIPSAEVICEAAYQHRREIVEKVTEERVKIKPHPYKKTGPWSTRKIITPEQLWAYARGEAQDIKIGKA